jgi:hypothetical protein
MVTRTDLKIRTKPVTPPLTFEVVTRGIAVLILGALASGSLAWYASTQAGWWQFVTFTLAVLLALRMAR